MNQDSQNLMTIKAYFIHNYKRKSIKIAFNHLLKLEQLFIKQCLNLLVKVSSRLSKVIQKVLYIQVIFNKILNYNVNLINQEPHLFIRQLKSQLSDVLHRFFRRKLKAQEIKVSHQNKKQLHLQKILSNFKIYQNYKDNLNRK